MNYLHNASHVWYDKSKHAGDVQFSSPSSGMTSQL